MTIYTPENQLIKHKIQEMKRKFSQTKPKDPSPIRISFPRSSDNQLNAARVDEPKTSEYSFFKKLRRDHAGHSHSHHALQHKERIRSKTSSRSSEYRNIERSSAIKNLRLPVEDLSRVDPGLCLSPVVEVELNRASTTFGDICSTSMEEYGNTLRNAETQNEHEDLFSAKRRKLLQWVTDISFPEIKELCSKGYDFVSVLLSRLLPGSNEENSSKIQMCGQAERNTESKLLTSPYSTVNSLKVCHTPTRNFLEVECDSYLESGESSCWLDRLRGRTSSDTPDSPTCHAQNIILDYNLREPSFDLGKMNTNSWIESDSSFKFLSENYGYLPSSRLRELDDFHCSDRSLLAREHHPLLLGWDSQNVANDTTSAIISHNTELIACPTSLISWSNNHDRSLDDRFVAHDASGLSVSSIICKYPPNFFPLPPSPSTSYCKRDFGRHFTEDNEDMTADLSPYPLALSHTPKYLCLTEDLNYDIEYRSSRAALLSPGNHGCFSRKVSRESRHDSDTDQTLRNSELDYYLERNYLLINESSSKHCVSIDHDPQFPWKDAILFSHILAKDKYEDWLELDEHLSTHSGILNYISKDMINVRDWSSFCFQMSLEHQKACPLLLGKSSWDEIEGETCRDDGEF